MRGAGLMAVLMLAACQPAAETDTQGEAQPPAAPAAPETPAPAEPAHTLVLDPMTYDEIHGLVPVEIGCSFLPAGSDASLFSVGLPDEPGAAIPGVVKFRGTLMPVTSDDNAPLFEGGRFTGYRVGVTVTMLGEVEPTGGEGAIGPARLEVHIADQTGVWTGEWGCNT